MKIAIWLKESDRIFMLRYLPNDLARKKFLPGYEGVPIYYTIRDNGAIQVYPKAAKGIEILKCTKI